LVRDIAKKTDAALTLPRKAVVETMEGNMHALTPVEVFDAARKQCPGLGLVSVYRTLEKLEQLGLVQRVHQTKGCQAFVRTGDGHQHLLCLSKMWQVCSIRRRPTRTSLQFDIQNNRFSD